MTNQILAEIEHINIFKNNKNLRKSMTSVLSPKRL